MNGSAHEQSEANRNGFKPKQVAWVNLDDEEDRDRETVSEFMRKYQKLWRNIFAKYLNTGHKANSLVKQSFDH